MTGTFLSKTEEWRDCTGQYGQRRYASKRPICICKHIRRRKGHLFFFSIATNLFQWDTNNSYDLFRVTDFLAHLIEGDNTGIISSAGLTMRLWPGTRGRTLCTDRAAGT